MYTYKAVYDETSGTYICLRQCPDGSSTYNSNGDKVYDSVCLSETHTFTQTNDDVEDDGVCCNLTNEEPTSSGCCTKQTDGSSNLIYDTSNSPIGCCTNGQLPSYQDGGVTDVRSEDICCNPNNIEIRTRSDGSEYNVCCEYGVDDLTGLCKTECGNTGENCDNCVFNDIDDTATNMSCVDTTDDYTECGGKKYAKTLEDSYTCVNDNWCQTDKVIYDPSNPQVANGCCTDGEEVTNFVDGNPTVCCSSDKVTGLSTDKTCCESGVKVTNVYGDVDNSLCCPQDEYSNSTGICCSASYMKDDDGIIVDNPYGPFDSSVGTVMGPDDSEYNVCCETGMAQFTVDDDDVPTKDGGETKWLCYDRCADGNLKVPTGSGFSCLNYHNDGEEVTDTDITYIFDKICNETGVVCIGQDLNDSDVIPVITSVNDLKEYCSYDNDGEQINGTNSPIYKLTIGVNANAATCIPLSSDNKSLPAQPFATNNVNEFKPYSLDIDNFDGNVDVNTNCNGVKFSTQDISQIQDGACGNPIKYTSDLLRANSGNRIEQVQFNNCSKLQGTIDCYKRMRVLEDQNADDYIDNLTDFVYEVDENDDTIGYCTAVFEPIAGKGQLSWKNPLDDNPNGDTQLIEANISSTGEFQEVLCPSTKFKIIGGDSEELTDTCTETMSNKANWCVRLPNSSGTSEKTGYSTCQEVFDDTNCKDFNELLIEHGTGQYKENDHTGDAYCPASCPIIDEYSQVQIWNPELADPKVLGSETQCLTPSEFTSVNSSYADMHQLYIVNNRTPYIIRATIYYKDTDGKDKNILKTEFDKKGVCIEPYTAMNRYSCRTDDDTYLADFNRQDKDEDDDDRKHQWRDDKIQEFYFYASNLTDSSAPSACTDMTASNSTIKVIWAIPSLDNYKAFMNEDTGSDYSVHIAGLRVQTEGDKTLCSYSDTKYTEEDKSSSTRVTKHLYFNEQSYHSDSSGYIDDGINNDKENGGVIFFMITDGTQPTDSNSVNFEKYVAVINGDEDSDGYGMFTVAKYNQTTMAEWETMGLLYYINTDTKINAGINNDTNPQNFIAKNFLNDSNSIIYWED